MKKQQKVVDLSIQRKNLYRMTHCGHALKETMTEFADSTEYQGMYTQKIQDDFWNCYDEVCLFLSLNKKE